MGNCAFEQKWVKQCTISAKYRVLEFKKKKKAIFDPLALQRKLFRQILILKLKWKLCP